MLRVLFLLLFVTVPHDAQTIDPMYPPLFASVMDVEKGDILNVRAKPSHKSTKVADIPSAYDFLFTFGVEKCKKVKSSIWCRVYPIVQHWSENFGGDVIGWVNARYLKSDNRGFVVINGEKNCDYSLRCLEGKCEVVYDYLIDDKIDVEHNIIGLKTKWVKREHLKGESHFGAMSEEGDGYCTSWQIEDYLMQKKLDELSKKYRTSSYIRAESFLKHLIAMDSTWLEVHFDPKLGAIMTEMVSFKDSVKLHVTRKDIKYLFQNRDKKLYWGKTYAKGDDIRMSVYKYFKSLTRPIYKLTEIRQLDKDLRAFKQIPDVQLKGYEFIWRNKGTELEEYTWLGLVVIVGKKKNGTEWYVVGIMRDRWTI